MPLTAPHGGVRILRAGGMECEIRPSHAYHGLRVGTILAFFCAAMHCCAAFLGCVSMPSRSRIGRIVRHAAFTAKDANELAESFAVLGLAPGASFADLRRAYRQKTKECHPDISANRGVDPEEASAMFVSIQTAYAQLSRMTNENNELPLDLDVWGGRFTWELSWVEAASLGAQGQEQALRDTVWFSLTWGRKIWGWELEGARRNKRGLPPRMAGPEILMQVLLPLLDEVTRRNLRINWAKMNGDTAGAAELRAGKSMRHRARDELLEALKSEGENSERVAELRQLFETLSDEVDITVDVDTSSKDWDFEIARGLAMKRKELSS